MSFEPEFVQSVFANEQEYSEDLRERYSASPVFERALEIQRELSKIRLEEKDVGAAWNKSQDFINSFESQASQEGLIGQVATLRGEGVEIPKFEASLSNIVGLISLSDTTALSEETLENYYQADEPKGIFSGFTLRYIKNEDESFTPHLAYQIGVAVIEIPHAHVNLYATGLVDKSQITFESDEKMDEVAPMLELLYELCGDKRLDSLSLINVALASSDTYDASRMRHVAYHAEKILKSVDESVATDIEDNLIDLVAHYIEKGERISIETAGLYLLPEKTGELPEYYDTDDESELYKSEGECIGFVFMHQPVIKNREQVGFRKYKSLYVVMTYNSRQMCVPLTRIQEFAKL